MSTRWLVIRICTPNALTAFPMRRAMLPREEIGHVFRAQDYAGMALDGAVEKALRE